MSSITSSSLYNQASADYQVRRIAQASSNVFSQGVIQISDQQSRDRDYEKGLEWIRSYIASLQAKLNTMIEETNVIYEQMLNELMYKRADTNNTAVIPNAYTTPSFDACLPYLGVAPGINKEVRNYQYNPFFGSRAIDLDNFNRSNSNGNTIARTYYDSNNTHHELGASFYSTLGYLWMWDVDRVNASYATTMDRYVAVRGSKEVLYVSKYDSLMDHTNPLDEDTDGDDIYYDPMLDINAPDPVYDMFGNIIGQKSNPKKYQVNATALQPNRGVFAPGVEAKADENSFELFEGFENAGVLKSLNLFDPNNNSYAAYDDCKWTQIFVNPYDRDQNKMSEHLQWRVVNNRYSRLDPSTSSNASVFFGDPTGTNYNYEYYVVKDNAENVLPNGQPVVNVVGPAFGDDYIDGLNGTSGSQYNADASNLFDTYGIPKNYPDPDNPASRFYDYPLNKDTNADTLTDIVKGGSNIDYNAYFEHVDPNTSIAISTAPNQKVGDPLRVKVQNADTGNWTQYYIKDKRDTADTLSSSWRIIDETTHPGGVEAFSGKNAYYFGNTEGNYGTVGLDPVTTGHTFTLSWSGQGDGNASCSFTNPGGCFDTFDIPTFQMQLNGVTKSVKGNSGSISFGPNEFIEGDNKLWVKMTDVDIDAWKYLGTAALLGALASGGGILLAGLIAAAGAATLTKFFFTGPYEADLTYSQYGLDSTDERKEKTYAPDIRFDLGLGGEPLPHNNIWGHGYIDGDGNMVIPKYEPELGIDVEQLRDAGLGFLDNALDARDEGSVILGETSGGGVTAGTNYDLIALDNRSPGLKIENILPYRPEGFMSRKIDLSMMAGMPGSSYEDLELRYRQNFQTETVGGDNSNKFDKRLALEYTGGSYYNELGVANTDYSGVTYTSQRADNRSTSNGWEQVYYELTPGFGTTNQQVALYFDAVDQFQNKEYRGWNVDDIEVVARGRSHGELISPKIDLSQYQNATLEFDSRFISNTRNKTGSPVKDSGDAIAAYYSTDGGASWNLLAGSNKTGSERDGGGADLMPSTFYQDNDQTGLSTEYWTNVKYDLSCVAGADDVRVKFVFEADADNNEGQGWNIDNVKVYGKKNAETDFYAYKQQIDSQFVSGSTNQNELWNENRPNISFDPRGTNIKGRFDEGASSRIEITNTDFPSFSNTLLTYVEQNASTYNANKVSSYATWGAPNTPVAVAILDSTVAGGLRVETTQNTKFYKDSMGRLINSDNEMYIDQAMAINLGLVKGVVPTGKQVDNKLTGWVNYDTTTKGLPYVDDTCFEEGTAVPGGANTYEFMTTFMKKTVGLTAAQATGAKTITVNVDTDAYLYVNGEKIGGVSNQNGSTTYTIPSGRLFEGFNTIMLQHNYAQGPDGIQITGSNIAGINTLDDTWTVRLYEGGYKGRDDTTLSSYGMGQDPQTGVFSQRLFDQEKIEYFGQEQEELKSLTLNFKNTDGKGVGILSAINEIELVATGEPTIQAFETKEFTTSTINDNGPLGAVLNYGYIDGKEVLANDPRAFNIAYKDHLNFTTDTNGFASMTLSAKGGNSMVNDATLLLKVHYFDDEDQDGVIDIDTDRDGFLSDPEITAGIAAGKRKTKYIGSEDRRDTSYYTSATVGHSGTAANSLATGVYNRFEVRGEVKLAATAFAGSNTITLTTDTDGTSATSPDRFLAGDQVTIGTQTLTVASASGNTLTFVQNLASTFTAGTVAYTNSYTGISDKKLRTDVDKDFAFKVYDNIVTASKGRSGGSTVEGNTNKLTEKLKSILDSQEYQEMLKYGLLDNVIVAATSSSSRGDQIVGKIILDWDWRKRRLKVTQGSFSAVYKS